MLVVVIGAAALSAAPAQGAVAFRAATSAKQTASSISVSKPSGTSAGDAMIAVISGSGTGDIPTPSGWTLVQESPGSPRLETFVKVAGSSEPGSYSFSVGSSRDIGAGISTYSGTDPTDPVDVSAQVSGVSSPGTAPTVTTTANGTINVLATGWTSGSDPSYSSGVSSRLAERRGSINVGLGDVAQATAGASTTRTVTGGGSGGRIHTIALQPPAVTASLTATFPSDLAWGAWAIGTNTSAEQVVSVTSTDPWGVKVQGDHADGRMTEWTGSTYTSQSLGDPLRWTLSSIGGVGQSASYAAMSSTPASVVSSRPAGTNVAIGLLLRQVVAYSDPIPVGGRSYRTVVTYSAAQGF